LISQSRLQLGGLIVAVGVVVDAAVIDVENVLRGARLMDNRAFKDQINLPCRWQGEMKRRSGVPMLVA